MYGYNFSICVSHNVAVNKAIKFKKKEFVSAL